MFLRNTSISVATLVALCALAGASTAHAQDDELGPDGEPAEPSPARPPAAGRGAVWGVLTDTKLGEPLPEAQVTVVGTQYETLTDIDGRYRLELPPGTYSLRFYFELHEPLRLNDVVVAAGAVGQVDGQLRPDEDAVETIEVETEADRSALEGQALLRQRSAAVGDSVGRAEISRTPDSNAAEAAQRVVGATIEGSRFVYVRGLGQRYTNSLLNGIPLPSPEPDINAVPLDLFPTLVLESLTIAKTFTPDVPGDFAGGSVRIDTREIPGKFLFSPSLSLGFNSQATFSDRLSQDGSGSDWLGFDDGKRALPGLPKYRLSRGVEKPGGAGPVLDDELERYGERINSDMTPGRAFTPPNFSGNVVIGDGFELGGDQRLGYVLALSYARSFSVRDERYREFRIDNGALTPNVDYEIEQGNDAVRWGAFGSLTYQLASGHRLSLTGLQSQLADITSRTAEGIDTITDLRVRQSRQRFASRTLSFGQLRGNHVFPRLMDAELDWNFSLARAGRNEPDTRDDAWEYPFRRSDTVQYNYSGSNAQAGRHLYTEQSENAISGGLDLTQPLARAPRDTKLKVGGLFSLRQRDFTARRFNFRFPRAGIQQGTAHFCPPPGYRQECTDALFSDESIGPLLRLDETTQASDAYEAELNIFAGYFMGDISLTRDLRVIAGERIEVTRQTIDPLNQFAQAQGGGNQEQVAGAALRETELLPAVALVYSATDRAKLRASATRTLARPQLRELAPFAYNEIVGGQIISGNPDLKLTKIVNLDLRFEYFPTLREVLAFSVFYKSFSDPIEPVIILTGGPNTVTFQNSPGANLIGVELEGRKSLGFLAKQLDRFSLISNLTLARSRIQINQTGNQLLNTSRPLVNQAPYVLNLALDYAGEHGTNVRVLYNVAGRRVVAVGTGGLDDAYEQPRNLIDIAVSQPFGEHFSVKLSAENILNSEFVVTQGASRTGDNVMRSYREGSTYSIGAQYTY